MFISLILKYKKGEGISPFLNPLCLYQNKDLITRLDVFPGEALFIYLQVPVDARPADCARPSPWTETSTPVTSFKPTSEQSSSADSPLCQRHQQKKTLETQFLISSNWTF